MVSRSPENESVANGVPPEPDSEESGSASVACGDKRFIESMLRRIIPGGSNIEFLEKAVSLAQEVLAKLRLPDRPLPKWQLENDRSKTAWKFFELDDQGQPGPSNASNTSLMVTIALMRS